MNRFRNGRGRRALPSLLLAGAFALTACDTDALLEVDEPIYATPGSLRTVEGLPTLFAGAIGDFQVGYSGADLTDSFLANASLFSDELKSSDTFTTRNATDARNSFPVVQGNTSDMAYNQLQYARRSTAETADIIEELVGREDARYGRLKALEGFAIVALGEGFCGAVPLGMADAGVPTAMGSPLTTEQLFTEAIARFDAGLAAAALGTSAAHTMALNMNRVGKGRALLNNGQYAAAATAVADVPTTFFYHVEHSANSGRQRNPIFALQDNRRYTMSDAEGTNGMPFITAADPRTPWYMHTQIGFDNSTPVFRSARYTTYGHNVVLADGVQARLIQAEAALAAGGDWLGPLNALRADVTALMNARYPNSQTYPQAANALPPLVDPGNAADRVNLLFRERAFWLYLSGTRLGDMRRLVRQYGRGAETVFPTGDWHKGGTYGTDVNLPIPFNEIQNPNYDPGLCNTNQA
jgi:starch-binding outer membrane protein, SusD/RagB family